VLTGMDLQQVERGERYVLLGPLPRMIP